MAKAKSAQFPYPFDHVFDAVTVALQRVKWKVKSSDRTLGYFRAKVGVNFWTWGEDLSINLDRVSSNATLVRVQGKAPYQLFDWGRTGRDIDKFMMQLERVLRESTMTKQTG